MNTPTVRDLLLEHYLAMQTEQKRKITEKQFAQLIGVNDKYYSNIYNLRQKPSEKIVIQLANFFEDPRFYDACGMERPDPSLDNLNRNWWRLSDDTKREIDRLVSHDKEANNAEKPITKKKPASSKL